MARKDKLVDVNIDEIKRRAQLAHADADLFGRLMALILADEGRESREAAWTLTHLPPTDRPRMARWREAIMALAIATADASLRRMSLCLLERMEWAKADVDPALLDFCLLRLADPAEPNGVRALCVKLAYSQCRHYRELCDELERTLAMLDPATLSPGVRHTVAWAIKQLDSSRSQPKG